MLPVTVRLALPLALVVVGSAQAPSGDAVAAAQLARLRAPEVEQREDARRRLSLLPLAELPRAGLAALLRPEALAQAKDASAAAAGLLAAHPEAHAELRALLDLDTAPATVLVAAMPALRDGDVFQLLGRELAADEDKARSREVADAALDQLARRGLLVDPRLVPLLAVESGVLVGCAARAADLAVHLARDLPNAWLAAVSASEPACLCLLRALADRPRTDTVPWLRTLLADSRDATRRLLAIAALPQAEQTAEHAKQVLAMLFEEVPTFLPDFVAARFAPKLADGLVAAMHARTLAGRSMRDMLGLLQNASPAAEQHLLALAASLPADPAGDVLRWLEVRGSAALRARAASELDAAEVDPRWLPHVGAALQDPARRARVVAMLADPHSQRAAQAFQLLLDAQVWDPALQAVADLDSDAPFERSRSLLRLPRTVLPEAVARAALLHRGDLVRVAAVDWLAGDRLSDEQARALERAHRGDDADVVRGAAARALTLAGPPEYALRAFRTAVGSGYAPGAVDWLLTRPPEFGLPLLREAREVRSGPILDDIDSARVRLGDLAPLPQLLARCRDLQLRYVRRIAPALAASDDAALVARLTQLLDDQSFDDLRREVLVEALAAQPQRHAALLERCYRSDEDDGVRLAALRGLLTTEFGNKLLRDLEADIGQRLLRSDDEDLAVELLGAAPLPLPEAMVEFAARLVLVAPLGNPTAEAALTCSDGGDAASYPLIQPLAELIRREPRAEHGAAIARVLAQARAHKHAHALSRRRLGYLFAYLSLSPAAFAPVAESLAAAIAAAPDQDPSWLGPACAVLAEAACDRGELAAAAELFARAQFHALAHPRGNTQRRRFLGDTDVARGELPLAALGARAELMRARVAAAAGRSDVVRGHLDAAQAQALGDIATSAEVVKWRGELSR